MKKDLLGAFIVPTGIGAAIGGFAGDASAVAREFSRRGRLIVNPNVVNAGGFSGINDNMLYVEGRSLDAFFRGEINLQPARNNKVSVIFDKGISQDVLNVHINTINAVKTVYGVDVCGYELTDEPVGVAFEIINGISTGTVANIETLIDASRRALSKGADALALVCLFEDIDDPQYAAGAGVDPIGGVEAVLSHCVSKELKIPCAHSPAVANYQICSDIVDPLASAEYITPTFLPCVLLGLNNAPRISKTGAISADNLDYLVMPAGALGSTPVFEAVKRGIKVLAVKENTCALNVDAAVLGLANITEVETYDEALHFLDDVF